MADDSIFKQYFPVSLMLAPAVLEGHSAKQLYMRGYIHDFNDARGSSFREFGNAEISVIAQHKQAHMTHTFTSNLRMKALLQMVARYESKMDSAFVNFFHQNS